MFIISILAIPILFIIIACLFFGIFLCVSGIVAGTTIVFVKNKQFKYFFGTFAGILLLSGIIRLLPFSINHVASYLIMPLSWALSVLILGISIMGIIWTHKLDNRILKVLSMVLYILVIITIVSIMIFVGFFII